MHSGAKGKSGSKKPIKKVPSWAQYKDTEVEKLVIKYAKAGKTTSEIGLILRDVHGVNSVKALTNKSILELVTENKLQKKLPEDIINLIKRMIAIKQHLEKNHKDESAHRGLALTMSKINRLVKYYKDSGRLPEDWKLDNSRLKMYIE
jgi:small subunit ribosomal protein S15